MEKLWTGDARMKYPKQWIVMVNLEDNRETHKTMGEVHLVTLDEDEAYDTAIALGDSMGENMVIRGHNPVQSELGGFEIWEIL